MSWIPNIIGGGTPRDTGMSPEEHEREARWEEFLNDHGEAFGQEDVMKVREVFLKYDESKGAITAQFAEKKWGEDGVKILDMIRGIEEGTPPAPAAVAAMKVPPEDQQMAA